LGELRKARRSKVGQKISKLLVLERIAYVNKIGKHNIKYKCLCDCGKETIVMQENLGRCTNSCGCAKSEIGLKRKKPEGYHPLNAIFWYYKRNARVRGLYWGLSKEKFFELIVMNCFYCGIIPEKKSGANKRIVYCNGVDRVNNTKGYLEENCVPCCSICNWSKNRLGYKDFVSWAIRISERIDIIKDYEPNFYQ
jgi:hypothetical protein